MNAPDLGTRLRVWRAERDYTQYDLGQKLGVGHNIISRFESGKQTPTAQQFKRLVKLGILAYGDIPEAK